MNQYGDIEVRAVAFNRAVRLLPYAEAIRLLQGAGYAGAAAHDRLGQIKIKAARMLAVRRQQKGGAL